MANPMEIINDLLRSPTKKVVAGIWTDEKTLVEAARKARAQGLDKVEAISPYPMHDIDDALGIPRSFIPYVAFVMGLTGLAFGTWLTWWTSVVDYPLIIGGKPMWSLPAFVPIMFECTILFAALSSVGAMIVAGGLPKVDPPIIDPDLTCSKFALFVPEDSNSYDEAKLEQLFKEWGASEVKKAEF
tara:strand:- start:767 stop:1324 length:558 start_codon:yes stop_codon:yes gene_type:complete